MDKYYKMLAGLTIFILILRLAIAFSTPYFDDDRSYLELRQIEYIMENWRPMYYDSYSFGGRERIGFPAFYFPVAGLGTLIGAANAAKILTNIFASSLTVASYLISYLLIKNKKIALITALSTSFVPVFFSETVNKISIYSFVIPSVFFIIYLLLTLKKKKQNLLLIALLSLVQISPFSAALVVGLIIYAAMCFVEKIRLQKSVLEVIFFSLFFFMWSNFIIYKKALQTHNLAVIWHNIPTDLVSEYFNRAGYNLISLIGIIPLIAGVLAIYLYLFKKKSNTSYLVIGLCVSSFIFFWFRLLEVTPGIIFLGVSLSVLASIYLKEFILLFRKTKISGYEHHAISLIIVLILITSIAPSIALAFRGKIPEPDDIEAYKWLRENTDKNDIILVPYTIGHQLSYFAERKNVADSDFILIKDTSQRLADIRTIYTTTFIIDATKLLRKYNIEYLVFNNEASETFGVERLKYSDSDCFELVYDKNVKIFRPVCEVK